eukprot:3942124-Lingulodinium_polyedra.AAC.1
MASMAASRCLSSTCASSASAPRRPAAGCACTCAPCPPPEPPWCVPPPAPFHMARPRAARPPCMLHLPYARTSVQPSSAC